MTTITPKSAADPMAGLEDGMSIPREPKCTTASSASKPAEPAAPKSEVDTYETQARLEEVQAKRANLKPQLEEKRTEAMRQLPKALPYAGTLSQVGFAFWDLLTGNNAKKQVLEAGKSMAETKVINEVGNAAVDKFGEGAGHAIEAVAKFKDGYDIYAAMREYGKLVKQDEALRYEAEDLMMKLDPTKQFELVKVNGKVLFRQDGKLIVPQEKASASDHDVVAGIRCRNNDRR
ncbi:MAG: hypothetical protein QM765_43610 [Myxococcales bacterium]